MLARVIVDQDQVMLTARGVTLLVEKLHSTEDNVIVLAASLLSSLAHTRAGIPDAMVTTGAIDVLVEKLSSQNDQVRSACAVALGYLTFNRTAARILFSACRNTPGLYKKLDENIGKNAKISQEFVQDFKRAKIVGLPSQWFVLNSHLDLYPSVWISNYIYSYIYSSRKIWVLNSWFWLWLSWSQTCTGVFWSVLI